MPTASPARRAQVAVGHQALGNMPADAGAAFDRPDPIGEGTTGLQHLLVAVGIGAETALGQDLFSLVDGLDRGRSLVRIHPDHDTTHTLVPPGGCSHA
ncbi:hypothetical protein [Micromonospora sp. NPDC005171]|uniref:hypothetical protein n=1 Tax=Micromonospora sp. NPDC005171 TaxID=3156866 RepID=UPI0033A54026